VTRGVTDLRCGAHQDSSVTGEMVDDTAIRTPDQRLRVFVSSTLGELADERAAASRAISTLRLTPVLFGLGGKPASAPGAVPGLSRPE
jgi:hypothetical protein